MQKEVLMLRDSLFMAILTRAYALGTCLAQPGLLGICLAAAWQAKPLSKERRDKQVHRTTR